MDFFDSIRGQLAQLLEVPAESISNDTVLADQPNWDSLTIVTLIAFLIEQGHGSPDPHLIDGVVTFGDLVRIAAPR